MFIYSQIVFTFLFISGRIFCTREQTLQKRVITIIDNPGDSIRAPVVLVPFVQVKRWRYNGTMVVDGADAVRGRQF